MKYDPDYIPPFLRGKPKYYIYRHKRQRDPRMSFYDIHRFPPHEGEELAKDGMFVFLSAHTGEPPRKPCQCAQCQYQRREEVSKNWGQIKLLT